MLKTNKNKLIELSVMGDIISPKFPAQPYRVTEDGKPVILPGVGGITYNIKVGDPACGWVADHIEPCVTIKNKEALYNGGLNVLAHIGNEARVVTGDAKGAKGVVTGKHGGVEHILIDFSDSVLKKLKHGDSILIQGFGLGLELTDFPKILVRNLAPNFLNKIPIQKTKKNKLKIPVTMSMPACIMGSGIGKQHAYTGDYDAQLFDKKIVKKYGLNKMRLGDLVAITDTDHSYGRTYQTGAITVGIVVHSDCVISGHGPGIATLFTSKEGMIEPVINKNANIGYYVKIGKWRSKK